MRLSRILPFAFCALLLLAVHPAGASAQGDAPGFVPAEVVIGWTPPDSVVPASRGTARLDEDRSTLEWQTAVLELSARTGLPVADVQPEYGTALLSVPAGQEEAEIARLRKLPWVAYAEPNYIAARPPMPCTRTIPPSATSGICVVSTHLKPGR